MRVVIFVDNDDKNRQIKKTIIMMMMIKKSHKPMIGCLHVGQLDNLGLQLEHTGWPERHWVEMEIIQEVENKNKNRRQTKPEKSALAGSSPQCRLGTQAPRAFPLLEQPEDNVGQPDQRHDAEVEDAHNKLLRTSIMTKESSCALTSSTFF